MNRTLKHSQCSSVGYDAEPPAVLKNFSPNSTRYPRPERRVLAQDTVKRGVTTIKIMRGLRTASPSSPQRWKCIAPPSCRGLANQTFPRNGLSQGSGTRSLRRDRDRRLPLHLSGVTDTRRAACSSSPSTSKQSDVQLNPDTFPPAEGFPSHGTSDQERTRKGERWRGIGMGAERSIISSHDLNTLLFSGAHFVLSYVPPTRINTSTSSTAPSYPARTARA